MKPAVIGSTIVLTGALVLTATAFASNPQAHERSAPPASAPREAAVPRSAPPTASASAASGACARSAAGARTKRRGQPTGAAHLFHAA